MYSVFGAEFWVGVRAGFTGYAVRTSSQNESAAHGGVQQSAVAFNVGTSRAKFADAVVVVSARFGCGGGRFSICAG